MTVHTHGSLKAIFVLVIAGIGLPAGLSGAPLESQARFYAGGVEVRDFGSHSLLELSHDWDFWPLSFIDPGDIAREGRPTYRVPVPSPWSRYGIQDLAGFGHGTYHLRLVGLPPAQVLALRLPNITSAYVVFVDGQELYRQGQPSGDIEGERQLVKPHILMLAPRESTSLDLVLHVSNHLELQGGITEPVVLAGVEGMAGLRLRRLIPELGVVGALTLIALFSLVFFFVRLNQPRFLLLGLIALNFAIRVLCYGEHLIFDLFPSVSSGFVFRLGYITGVLPYALFAPFFRSLFPGQFGRWFVGVSVAYGLALTGFDALAPLPWLPELLKLAWVLLVVFGLYLLWRLIAATFKREPGSLTILLATFLFLVLSIYDILVASTFIRGGFAAQLGVLIFFFATTIVAVKVQRPPTPSRAADSGEKPTYSLGGHGLSLTEATYVLELHRGFSVKEIASLHGISDSTVRNTLSRVYLKLGTRTMTDLRILLSSYQVLP